MFTNEVSIKNYTVRQLYDSIVKNGLPEVRGQWITLDEEGNIVAGCLLTQGAINLEVIPTMDVVDNLNVADEYTIFIQLNEKVPLNIKSKYSKPPTFTRNGKPFQFSWQWDDLTGFAIVAWYDSWDKENGKYELETHEEVLNMLYELLSPSFDVELELASSEGVEWMDTSI